MITISKDEIAALRRRLGLSQPEFARRYHIQLGTWLGWEQGNRIPRGASALYLRMIEYDPEYVAEVAASLVASTKKRARLSDVMERV